MALAIVQEEPHSVAQTRDEQIQFAVAIDISENSAGRILPRAAHSRSGRHIFELPVAQIAIERVVCIQTAKVEIAQAIAVDITRRHAGSVQKIPIDNGARFGNVIAEANPKSGRFELNESNLALHRDG